MLLIAASFRLPSGRAQDSHPAAMSVARQATGVCCLHSTPHRSCMPASKPLLLSLQPAHYSPAKSQVTSHPASDRLVDEAAKYCVLLPCMNARHSSWQRIAHWQGCWCTPLELHDAALWTGKQQSPHDRQPPRLPEGGYLESISVHWGY